MQRACWGQDVEQAALQQPCITLSLMLSFCSCTAISNRPLEGFLRERVALKTACELMSVLVSVAILKKAIILTTSCLDKTLFQGIISLSGLAKRQVYSGYAYAMSMFVLWLSWGAVDTFAY